MMGLICTCIYIYIQIFMYKYIYIYIHVCSYILDPSMQLCNTQMVQLFSRDSENLMITMCGHDLGVRSLFSDKRLLIIGRYMSIHIQSYTYIYVYIYTYIYIYIYIHIFMYI